ncbi:MAG: FtsX-like permease family protein [Pseudomonadota bacterium]
METGPILRALSRNKTGALLIALQIAFTMTVVVNAWYMVGERLGNIDRPSGLLEEDIFYVSSTGFAEDFNIKVTIEEDLLALRQLPGVVDAVTINAVPLSGGGWSMGLRIDPGDDTQSWPVAVYMVDQHGVNTLGLNLVAGDDFDVADVEWREPGQTSWPDKVVISQAMATAMFPDMDLNNIVGKTVYISNDEPVMISGIVEKLQAPWSGWNSIEQSMLVPQKTAFSSVRYMVRTEPGRLDEVIPRVETTLLNLNDGRLVRNTMTMTETRERGYLLDQGLATILTVVMAVLLLITAVGVLGLASFSVRRRTRQIGVRRALGATQQDILRYFLVENACIALIGVFAGALMTVGLNAWLVGAMSFPKIQWGAIPIGMILLVLVAQLSVIGPARRACGVSPAVATRTV